MKLLLTGVLPWSVWSIARRLAQGGHEVTLVGLTEDSRGGGSGVRHVIIRTAWLYSEYGRNFVKTMLSLTASRPSLKVVFDQAGTPTYAADLARAIVAVLERFDSPEGGPCGIYHYSNEGVCSWYDFTKAIARFSGQTACDVQPCHSDEFPSKVRRPAYSVLDKTKIKETFGLKIPYWTDSLRICISNLTGRKPL